MKEEHSQIISKTVDDPYQIETLRFKITGLHNKPVLILPDGKRIKIPRVWLYPAKEKEVEEDQGAYVSSFKYLEDVTSFLIDKELLGLHIDSWDSMTSGHGSASAGAGRDIFLVYNSKTNRIYPGVIDLGITKDRVRSMGCFFATFHNFVLGDVNDDGLTDIGVKLEKIWCEEGYDEKKQVDTISAPYYKEYPIEWYVFRENRWEKAPQFNGVQPKMAIQKMPMIGLSKSPVDFVREIYKEELKVKK
ncbi:MAG: hypothetical protein HY753_07280 [Nitrospirae bacterium]|nr:hypothetical protein [Nitrospirota bacterium]